MSIDTEQLTPPSDEEVHGKTVLDEEDYVDQKQKEAILSLRRAVDTDESELFLAATQGQIRHEEAVTLWHSSIRRFLMSFEPLMCRDDGNDPEIAHADWYYWQAPLGEVTLTPPEEYQASTSMHDDGGDSDAVNLFHESAPEPKTVQVRGLKTVIDRDVFSATWTVTVDTTEETGRSRGSPVEERTLSDTQQFPKTVLRNAVRFGDRFLDNAGVGLKTGIERVDEEADPY